MSFLDKVDEICQEIDQLPLEEKVDALNQIRAKLHSVSPFQHEPVDNVQWVKAEYVSANDYNPNAVQAPEMKLLEESITKNGFAMPIVTHPMPTPSGEAVATTQDPQETVDGFHRGKVGKSKKISKRLHGYLPVAALKKNRHSMDARIAATVQFNRARGKHETELMSGLVSKLIQMGKTDLEVAKALGMSAEELLRLKQMTGLAGLFKDQPYSKAWVAHVK